MKEIFQIAIDGPSGAGKSTIAKIVANKLKIDYIDTGAMYRALGLKMIRKGIDAQEVEKVSQLLNDTVIDFSEGDILLDGEVVTSLIRTPEVSMKASSCSALAIVRRNMVASQQQMGAQKSVIMDGRDIATDVFPNAKYKFYITASAEERANRRYKELAEKGENVSFEETLAAIEARDYNDMNRDVSPLRQAEDAELVDTTEMTIDQVADYICSKIEEK